MIVRSTLIFRESLRQLCRKPKHNYDSCPKDICQVLAGRPVEDLLISNNVKINDDGNKCLLKIRVPCERRNQGKSGGFRLIAMIDRQAQEAVLLEVYPKVGPFGKDNLSREELKDVVEFFIKERDSGSLVTLDANNALAVIP